MVVGCRYLWDLPVVSAGPLCGVLVGLCSLKDTHPMTITVDTTANLVTVPPSRAALESAAAGTLVIGLTGFARSGKDTVGGVLTGGHEFRRVAFGDTIKAVAVDMDPIIEYRTVRGLVQSRLAALLAVFGGWEGVKDAVPETRVYLVDLGNSLRHRISGVEIAASFGGVVPGDRVVNTNVYHSEEIDGIRAMGGFVVRVVRPGFGPANPDEARTGAHPVDYVIVNHGDEAELAEQVDAFIVWVHEQAFSLTAV